jgi:hypothetical protein
VATSPRELHSGSLLAESGFLVVTPHAYRTKTAGTARSATPATIPPKAADFHGISVSGFLKRRPRCPTGSPPSDNVQRALERMANQRV